MYQRKPNNRDQTGVREITIKMAVAMTQDPKVKAVTEIMMQLEIINSS